MAITLRQLRVFLAVAEHRHFRRAAEQLFLSQPAVSRQVAELEADLGRPLFVRGTRQASLTEAGEQLREAVTPLLAQLDGALARLRQGDDPATVPVAIGAVPTLSANLLPAFVATMAKEQPALALALHELPQHRLLESLRHGEVDFALAIDPPDSDDLVMQTVLHDPFHLVCRSDDPLAALDQVPWRALDDRALVLLDHGSGSRRLIDDLLAHHGVHARVVQQAAHTYTVFRMVEASLGISITPGLSLPLPADASLVVRPLLPRAERAIRLVRRHQPALSPSARLAWERLQALAAPLAAEEVAVP